MKLIPAVVLVSLLAVSAAGADAQSAEGKQVKGNSKHDEYMTNEFYKTSPLTTDKKGNTGSGKSSRHHEARLNSGRGGGKTHEGGADQSSIASGIGSGSNQEKGGPSKTASNATGKRMHTPLANQRHKR